MGCGMLICCVVIMWFWVGFDGVGLYYLVLVLLILLI